jgi:AcrR family transcriptional regulator
VGARRTQKQRRDGTIAALYQATIECIASLGYGGATTTQICATAGVTTGALFRYFPTRQALMASVAAEIGARHLARFQALVAGDEPDPTGNSDRIGALVRFCRDATRDTTSVAWHAILVAARADPVLREAAREPLRTFESSVIAMAPQLLPGPARDPLRLGTMVLTMLHTFDSESLTVSVLENPAVEQARIGWFVEMLEREVAWQSDLND